VKYFHPYLAYRDNIDWDAALVKAIPKVNAARTPALYANAVEGMLNELSDPATHVLAAASPQAPESRSSAERQPTFRKNAGNVLVVTMTNYSDFEDFAGTGEKLEALQKELPTSTAVVFDLRPARTPSEEEHGMASSAIAESGLPGLFSTVSLDMPGERQRMHRGYAPQQGTTSGDYTSGFCFRGRPGIETESGARDIPVVFLIGPGADLPDIALALQASGKGAVVAEGTLNEEVAVGTQIVDLPEGVRAQMRLGELVYPDGTIGFLPNVTVPISNVAGDENPAFQEAIRLAKAGQFTPPSRAKVPLRATAPRDRTYSDMQYPPAEYRILAAFRLWAVINYFFPYKDLMGEDWNDVLRQFIPRMEGARDALDYNLAVLEMKTHLHDSHAGAGGPVLEKYLGEAVAPLRLRMIEGVPVITGFTNGAVAKDAKS
jgi:hypothetical protein